MKMLPFIDMTTLCQNFLRNIPLPSVNVMQNEILKKPLSIEELENSIENSQNGKSPGNDGLTREFYIVFWPNFPQCLFGSLIDEKTRVFYHPHRDKL